RQMVTELEGQLRALEASLAELRRGGGASGHRNRNGRALFQVRPVGDMLVFAHHAESQAFERLHDSTFWRILGEARHQLATSASATNASSTGESAAKASLPKVSRWKRMADLTSASASSYESPSPTTTPFMPSG